MNGTYEHTGIGFNSRLDEIQAAVLLVKFKRIQEYNERRRSRAALYSRLLEDRVSCPAEKAGAYHVYHQYTIRSPKRDQIKQALHEADIASTIYYPCPLHLQPALSYLGHKKGDFPLTEQASDEVLSLPICPELEDEDATRVAETVLSV